MKLSEKSPFFFQPRLEALRGYAALMVAYAHSIGAVKIVNSESSIIKQILNIIGNGGAGVTIFFILSGYVLMLSLNRLSSLSPWVLYLNFIFRRFLRIFPAMLVCLLFCFFWVNFLHTPMKFEAASNDYYLYWNGPISIVELVKNLVFISNSLNPVTWTLQVELLASIVFLPLWLLCKRSIKIALFLLLTFIAYFWLTPLYSFARSGFVFMFILGMLINYSAAWMESNFKSVSLGYIGWGAYILCCTVNKLFPETTALGWIFEALMGYILIASLVAGSQKKLKLQVLDHKIPRFLGKISYSFYLWHFPLLFISGTWLFKIIPGNWILLWPNLFQNILFLVSTIVTIPLAWLSYCYIEKPFKFKS